VRLGREIVHNWVRGSKLAIRRSMTGATGNIYVGLHEFPEMGFLLHFLQPDDIFFDVGANVGSYTILASRACGARSVAFEPDPDTADRLRRNVALNSIQDRVTVEQSAVGSARGTVRFSTGLDTMNSLLEQSDAVGQDVQCVRLDDLVHGVPALIKIDVEGFEQGVFEGAMRLLQEPNLLAIMAENLTPDILGWLADAGFERAYYDPRARTLSDTPHAMKESNSLFIRNRDACVARVRTAAPFGVLGRSY
jgi:FkbM family methyltransferase